MLLKFDEILGSVLKEEFDGDFTAAVGIVQIRDRWLVGLARETGDDRTGKWCHAGGGIKSGESPQKAAVREVFEEIGVRCKSVGEPWRDSKHKGVAFVHCKAISGQKIKVNHEFSAAGFFTLKELKSLKPLYKNVLSLINHAKNS